MNKKQFSLLLQMLSIPFNPFTWVRTSERVYSDVLTLDLKDDKRKNIKVSHLSSDIFMRIPLKDQINVLEYPHFFTKNGTSRFHKIKIDHENTLLQLEITPEDATVNLLIFMRFGDRPTNQVHDLNGTVSSKQRCIWKHMPGNVKIKGGCSPNGLTPIQILAQKPGNYYIEVQSWESFVQPQKRQKRSCLGHRRQKRSCVEVKSPPPIATQSVVPEYDPNTGQNYTMRVTLGSCVYWSDERQMWTTEGCQVRNDLLDEFCECLHGTKCLTLLS